MEEKPELQREISGQTYQYQSGVDGLLGGHAIWVKPEKKARPMPKLENELMPLAPMEEIHKRHKIYV